VINVASPQQGEGGRTLVVDLHLTHGDAAVLLGRRALLGDGRSETQRLDETFLKDWSPRRPGPITSLVRTGARQPAGASAAPSSRRRPGLSLCRAGRAALRRGALDASTATCIIVVANQAHRRRNASRIASSLRQRYGKDKVHVVVNRFDKDSEITHQDLERVLGGAVRHFLPSDYRRALKALNAGRPMTVENHSTLAAAYVGLAHELAGIKPPEPEKHPEAGGLFSIFTNRK
jgi:pilus assembly protein CpaE